MEIIEYWKDVFGYEGIYQVSNLGNIKSLNYLKTGKERILCQRKQRYLDINLCKDGIIKKRSVHSIVAEAFIDKDYRLKGLVVNHINFKKYDNRVENLEVITCRENTNLKHLPSTSQYTGVCWNKNDRKWKSKIKINGKTKHLGTFDNEKEASDYYEAALVCINEGRIEQIQVKVKNFRSKYRGISFNKASNKWHAFGRLNGKRKHIGCFDTEEKALYALVEFNNLIK